jgi:hypothetical protein
MRFRPFRRYDMPNRYVCDVLKEIRAAYDVRQYTIIPGLVEEAQTMVNRMEAALKDYNDAKWDEKDLRKLKKERRDLEKEIEELELKKEFLEEKRDKK